MFKWLTTYLGFEDHCKALTAGGQMNKGNIQTSAPPSSRTTPYLWRMAPIRRSAPPPLYFAVCPKFSLCLKFCAIAKCWAWLHLPADGSKWSWLQNWPLGPRRKKDANLRAGLMEAYLCDLNLFRFCFTIHWLPMWDQTSWRILTHYFKFLLGSHHPQLILPSALLIILSS